MRPGSRPPTPTSRKLALRRRLGDTEGTAHLARQVLERQPGRTAVHLELASALARQGGLAALRHELTSLRRATPSLELLLELSRLHLEADECDEAEALAAQAHAAWPQEVQPLLALSRFAAWRGEAAAAERWARQALSLADSADGWCALGGALHLGGDEAGGGAAIERACAMDPRHLEAQVWRAERCAARGERAAVLEALDAATPSAEGALPVVALVLRALGALNPAFNPRQLSGYRSEEFAEALCELVPEAAAVLANPTFHGLQAVLRQALHASRGNRGLQPTRMHEGRLRRLSVRSAPRQASRVALDALRYLPAERVAARLDALERRYPASPLPACHRGELALGGRAGAGRGRFSRGHPEGPRHPLRVDWPVGRGAAARPARGGARGLPGGREGDGRHLGPGGVRLSREAVRNWAGSPRRSRTSSRRWPPRPRRLSAWLNLALVHHLSGRPPRPPRSSPRSEIERRGSSPTRGASWKSAGAPPTGPRWWSTRW